jgi:hypothetical protein
MTRSSRLALLTVGLGVAFSTGCYTLLKHPAVVYEADDSDYEYEYEPIAVQWNDDCVSCHTGADVYYNPTSPYNYYYDRGYERWVWYYDLPWWSEQVSYFPASEDSSKLPNPRRFGRRGSRGRGTTEIAPPAASTTPPSTAGAMSKRRSGDTSVKGDDEQKTKRQPKARDSDTKKRRKRKKSG